MREAEEQEGVAEMDPSKSCGFGEVREVLIFDEESYLIYQPSKLNFC